MRRVVILGCAGSGKTTLARTMGERLTLPVIHLDTLWEPCDPEAFREKLPAAVAGDAWVTEGHPDQVRDFAETLALCVPRADLVLFVHQPRWLSLWRVIRRWLTYRGRTRPDLPEGWPEQLDWPSLKWIWTFERRVRPAAERALAAYATPVVHLKGDRDIAAFLDGLMLRAGGQAASVVADQTLY
jgi:adenylate kinase family enzyme